MSSINQLRCRPAPALSRAVLCHQMPARSAMPATTTSTQKRDKARGRGPTHQQRRQQRKHQIEMFFHAQRPGVRERGIAAVIDEQVQGEADKHPPRCQPGRLTKLRPRHVDRQHHQKRRQDAKRAAQIERLEVQALPVRQRPQYLRADQKTAQHEEQVHAHPAVAGQPRPVRPQAADHEGMEQHHPDDGDATQQIEGGIAHADDARRGSPIVPHPADAAMPASTLAAATRPAPHPCRTQRPAVTPSRLAAANPLSTLWFPHSVLHHTTACITRRPAARSARSAPPTPPVAAIPMLPADPPPG